jgi:hypothetical protein
MSAGASHTRSFISGGRARRRTSNPTIDTLGRTVSPPIACLYGRRADVVVGVVLGHLTAGAGKVATAPVESGP